jgi:hypothetical protein
MNAQRFKHQLYLEALSFVRSGYGDAYNAADSALSGAAAELSMQDFAEMLQAAAPGGRDYNLVREIEALVQGTTEEKAKELLCQECGKGVPLGHTTSDAIQLGIRPELCARCFVKLGEGFAP